MVCNVCIPDCNYGNGFPQIMAVVHVDIKQYTNVLSKYVTQERRHLLKKVASSRNDRVSIVLENVIDTGNENAVVRTMEGLGFLRLYRIRDNPLLISSKKLNRLQRTDSGARKWLLTHSYCNVRDCLNAVKEDGYRLACAVPNTPQSIYDIKLDKKTAFVFGNESNGVSQILQDESEINFTIPMHGFVKSYNVSVAAAITLYHAYTSCMHITKVCFDTLYCR